MKRWVLVATMVVACVFLFYSLGNASGQLEATRVNLQGTQSELASVRAELDLVNTLLDAARSEVATMEKVLDLAKNELATTRSSLGTTRAELDGALINLSTRTAELQFTRDELSRQRNELASLQVSYQGLVSGHGYSLKDPTYEQLLAFLADDATDKKTYLPGRYECRHFATEVCNNADAKGIRCAYVSLGYPDDMGHAIVAFETIDKGLIYVEPQSDELVELEMGKRYYQCVVPSGNYHYVPPPYDDTILEVLVAW